MKYLEGVGQAANVVVCLDGRTGSLVRDTLDAKYGQFPLQSYDVEASLHIGIELWYMSISSWNNGTSLNLQCPAKTKQPGRRWGCAWPPPRCGEPLSGTDQ